MSVVQSVSNKRHSDCYDSSKSGNGLPFCILI
jgi:hypothetical protein